ncbi:MAG TPA: hypothetical protein VFB21_26050 [Chthonomonadaceae bacterium]|nr:hypothetical protein [Chthonomonadaceae bacterium]
MKQQISGPVAGVILALVLVVIALIGYKYLGSPQRDVSPREQVEMMKHMKHQ